MVTASNTRSTIYCYCSQEFEEGGWQQSCERKDQHKVYIKAKSKASTSQRSVGAEVWRDATYIQTLEKINHHQESTGTVIHSVPHLQTKHVKEQRHGPPMYQYYMIVYLTLNAHHRTRLFCKTMEEINKHTHMITLHHTKPWTWYRNNNSTFFPINCENVVLATWKIFINVFGLLKFSGHKNSTQIWKILWNKRKPEKH